MIHQGQAAPDFEFTDLQGNKKQLSNFLGTRLILYFYPKDNTPGCTAEACDLRDNYKRLLADGFYIIGISPDSEKSHENFRKNLSLPFPLVADEDKKIINAYGVWGMKKFMGKTYEGVLRTTFIINKEGLIEHIIEKVKTKDSTNQIYNELKLN